MSFGSEYRQAKQEEKSATIVAVTVGGIGSAVVVGCLVFGVMLYDQIANPPSKRGLDGTERTAAARAATDPEKLYARCMALVSGANKIEQGFLRMYGQGAGAEMHDLTMGADRRAQCRKYAEDGGR